MVCPSCGTPNSNQFKFCPECGERLAPAAASPAASATPAAASPSPAARVDEAAQAARLLDHAFQLYDDGQYDEALGCCQASLALDPEASTAHSLLGMIYERLGKTAEAVQQYQLVLRMNPDSIADAIKLETLVSRSSGPGAPGIKRFVRPGGRVPAAAGALAAVAALVVGIWATSRAGGAGSDSRRRVGSYPAATPIPGAALPRGTSPSPVAPSAPETAAPAGTAAPMMLGSNAAAGAASAGGRPVAAVPAPPPSNAWPAPQHAAYPPAQPIHGQPGASMASAGRVAPFGRRGTRTGYLAPAPIPGIEKIEPGQQATPTDVPGASLPAMAAVPPRRSARGGVPVLPSVSPTATERPVAQLPPPSTALPTAPPSASINIQPLDDSAATGPARAPQRAAPPARPPSLSEALQHQQMAAYYRRQGDDQAAYGEYQSARDLFLRIQQRGGREAAVAAQGAVAAQYGMSRLQGP